MRMYTPSNLNKQIRHFAPNLSTSVQLCAKLHFKIYQ